MRKAINFFRSYYDIANELSDKDRLNFYDAIMNKQFENIEPNLNGMAKFAYLSQKHSINAQIKGYYDKTKNEKFNPINGGKVYPTLGGEVAPSVQEQVKEKEKEKVEYTIAKPIDFDRLLKYINNSFGRNFLKVNDNIKAKYKSRIKEGYEIEDIKNCIDNLKENQYHKDNGYQYCTPEFISRSQTLDKYSLKTIETKLSNEDEYVANVMKQVNANKLL
jgi:uncharacterized phage protein (TIGR02220 family)